MDQAFFMMGSFDKLFHGWEDDAAQDDALAEEENCRGWDGDDDEACHDAPRLVGEGL